jgi:hypothetical protein
MCSEGWRRSFMVSASECSLSIVAYSNIRRRAVHNRMKPAGAVGITSRFIHDGKEYHLLFLDVDGGANHLRNVLLYLDGRCRALTVVKTMKGFHVICYDHFTWSECIKHWKRLKSVIDSKWINLQVKLKKLNYRSGAILRVSGKYGVRDIKLLIAVVYDDDPCIAKLFTQYILMVVR